MCFLLVACGGGTTTPASTGSNDGGSRGDGSPPSGEDASVDALVDVSVDDAPVDIDAYLACFTASGAISSSLKSCQSNADCVIKQEETDCCGTMQDVGVNAASASAFDACEAAWAAHFPNCGCATGPTETEDGKTVTPDSGAPQVRCMLVSTSVGNCTTYLP